MEYVNGRIVAYDKRQPPPRMHYLDYGLGVFHRSASELVPHDRPAELAQSQSKRHAQRDAAAYPGQRELYGTGAG